MYNLLKLHKEVYFGQTSIILLEKKFKIRISCEYAQLQSIKYKVCLNNEQFQRSCDDKLSVVLTSQ